VNQDDGSSVSAGVVDVQFRVSNQSVMSGELGHRRTPSIGLGLRHVRTASTALLVFVPMTAVVNHGCDRGRRVLAVVDV